MTENTRSPAARERATALVTELRATIDALSSRELSEERLAEATRLATSLRARLDGPASARWYDSGEDPTSLSRASRGAYLDQSPIRGRLNPIAPPLELEVIEREDGGRSVRGRARLGRAYEGPPHGVHGGWVAALFDDLLGSTQGVTRTPGVTATLTVRYRAVTPIDEELHFEAWIERDTGRRVVAKGTCHAGDTLTAEAEGLFVRVDFNEVEERMRQRAIRRNA
jgi:acyl-coenzyme A thioesterase PaaI-like protein